MAKWVLSPIAESELTEILEYIAEQSGSLVVADRVRMDFATAFDKLADSPGMGSERKELTGEGPRWWRVHKYSAIYLPETKPLQIVRIVHGMRCLEALFEDTMDAE